MKRKIGLLCLLIIAAMILPLISFAASSVDFSHDANAINKAVKSVLKLEVKDSSGNLIATGSGFVAFSNQYIITNYHVVESAASVVAISDDEKKYFPDYVACADKLKDIAILGFKDRTDLEPLSLHPDKNLLRGSEVIAIGSPIGIKNTVSSGIISAVYEEDDVPWIQITAPISHGSSGGAVFNNYGEVIGISSASYVKGQNLNLAINIGEAIAMYKGWDGVSYHINNLPKSAVFDYTGVYPTEEESQLALFDNIEWICLNCGQKNNKAFCLQCGAVRPLWKCVCGELNVSQFCGVCGQSLEGIKGIIENAEACIKEDEFEKAVGLVKQLGKFDSYEIETCAGSHYKAEDRLQLIYIQWSTFLVSKLQYKDAIDAISDMEESVEKNSILTDAYSKWYQSLVASGEYEEAISVAQSMNQSDSSETALNDVYKMWAQELIDKEEYDEAFVVFDKMSDSAEKKEIKQLLNYKVGARYYDAGDFLNAAKSFSEAGDYENSYELRILSCYNVAMKLQDEGEDDKAIEYLDEAKKCISRISGIGNKHELNVKVSEEIYQLALKKVKNGSYKKAEMYLELIPDYENTQGLKDEIRYDNAMKVYNEEGFESALRYFRVAKSYPETLATMEKIYNAEYERAALNNDTEYMDYIVSEAEKDHITLEDRICFRPGVTGEGVQEFFQLVKDLGYIKKADSTYKDEYIAIIEALETRLGLGADGIIYTNELSEIENVLYPGCQSEAVAKILEHLVDAGYIKGMLPEDHTMYKKDYQNAVLKAKKNCGLNPDVLISQEEYDEIMKIPVIEVAPVSGINAKTKASKDWNPNDSNEKDYGVSITWKASKNALFYDVYRNGSLLAGQVKGTSYKDILPGDGIYKYSIIARNYEYKSDLVSSDEVSVGPVHVTARELLNDIPKYRNIKVVLSESSVFSYEQEGKIVYILMGSNDYPVYCKIYHKYSDFEVKGSSLYWDGSHVDSPSILYGKLNGEQRWNSEYGNVNVFEIVHCIFFMDRGGMGF